MRYCRGVDRLDPREMKRAYWPEATDHHGTFVGNAWEFVDHCMESHKRWQSTAHCIFNHLIELDDENFARGEIYNVTYLFYPDGTADTWHGRYLDKYEKRDNQWRIIERVCVNLSTNTSQTTPMDIPADQFTQDSFDRAQTTPKLLGP